MALNIFNTTEEVFEALAEKIVFIGNNAIEHSGRFNLVLTGGNSPKELHRLLATKYASAIDWQKVYFFFGDERYVPSTDKDFNGGMAKTTLLDPLNILDTNIFYVHTNLAPEVAAADYFNRIKDHFRSDQISFDFLILGMGDDAHTASMFPKTTILESTVATVEAVYVKKLAAWRISFTAKLINQAQEIAFLVLGASKADALDHVLNAKKDFERYPAQLINGHVNWYLDIEASKKLSRQL